MCGHRGPHIQQPLPCNGPDLPRIMFLLGCRINNYIPRANAVSTANINSPSSSSSYCCFDLFYSYCYFYYHYYYSRGGGGGTQVQRGAAPSLRISRKKGSFFKASACPRFCKRRVHFCNQVRSMGVKIPLQSTKYTRL